MDQYYQYEPLQTPSSIRMLRLSFGTDEQQIICEISQYELADAPVYTATSYFWGDPKHTGRVHVVGSNGNVQGWLGVHENLWHLLRNVCMQQRGRTDDRTYFWTDCLCLDQSNKEEVSQQVVRMGEVFSSAGHVLVWLGHEAELVRGLYTFNAWPERKHCSSCGGVLITKTSTETIKNVSSAINNLLAQPYWQRVWIVQEVVLGKAVTIMVEQALVDFDDFATKIDFFSTEYRIHTPQAALHGIRKLVKMREQPSRKYGFGQLLMDHTDRDSTQMRDRVYGLLGLAAQNEDGTSPTELIEANIDKESFEIYWDVVLACRVPFRFLLPRHLLISLSIRLGLDLSTEGGLGPTITKYIAQSRTSSVNRTRAGHVLWTFEAMSCLHAVTPNLFRTMDTLHQALCSEEDTMTDLQRTAAIGVALRWGSGVFHGSKYARWTCRFHVPPSESGCKLGLEGFFTRTTTLRNYALPHRRLDGLRCTLQSDGCDKSIMACTIAEIGFQLLAWQREELSENKAYISLALSYTPRVP